MAVPSVGLVLCLVTAFVACTAHTREPQLRDMLPLFMADSQGAADPENLPWKSVPVLVNTLVNRLLCVQQGLSHMDCVRCLTTLKLADLLGVNGSRSLRREDVTRISVLFLNHVLHFRTDCRQGSDCTSYVSCQQRTLQEFSHPTGNMLEGVERVLRTIKDVYEPLQRTNCFSGESLLAHLNISEADLPGDFLLKKITTLLIGHILKGDCINVGESVTDFMDDLFQRYGDKYHEHISREGLDKLIDDLKSKESHDHSHTGHKHSSHSQHDHSHSHDGHNQSHDHHSHDDHGHSHDHHSHDDHGHSHDHQSHDDHGHSHEDHDGHNHSHDSHDDHGHTHGDHDHSHDGHNQSHDDHDHSDHTNATSQNESSTEAHLPRASAYQQHPTGRGIVPVQEGPTVFRYPHLAYLSQNTAGETDHLLSTPHEHTSLASKCFSADGLLQTFGHARNGSIDRTEFVQLCPALLQQVVSKVCDLEETRRTVYQPTSKELYGYSSLAVLIISLCSLGGIFLLPILVKEVYHYVMMAFIGLSFSTMAGDALLHLIPQAVGLHSHEGHAGHDHSHDGPIMEPYLWKQLGILATIYCLFLFEAILGLFVKEGYQDNHGHSHIPQVVPDQLKMKSMRTKSESRTQLAFPRSASQDSGVTAESSQPSPMLNSETLCLGMTSLALVVTLGDAVHNFGDGLAIGAAFSSGIHSGLSTAVAVLCHELPHEFGDFVVLLSTGLSFTKALLLNMASALTCFVGLYLGILLGDNNEARQWIMATTAGIFLYVALTEMLPQLKEARRGSPVKMFLAQNIGVASGIVFMLIIAMYEDHIKV